MEYVVFDLASIRYRFGSNHASITALAPTGEILSRVDLSAHHTEREAAFLAADAALRGARLTRNGAICRLGLYNPYTAVICVSPVPDTKVFSDHSPVAIPKNGLVCEVSPSSVVLEDSRALALISSTPSSVSRDLAAHQLG